MWVLMFLVLFFFSLSCLSVPHLLTAAVWTPPCLAAAWIPSAQDVSPRWVNIVFLFLRARGVVVSRVLVPLPSVSLWPGLQRIPGWAFLPQAGCTSPGPPAPHLRPRHPTRSACLAPQHTVLDSLRSGEGSHPHLPVQIPRALSGRGCDQARGPELESKASENPHAGSAVGISLGFSSAAFPVGPYLAPEGGDSAGAVSPRLCTDPSPRASPHPPPRVPRGRGRASFALIEGSSAWSFERWSDEAGRRPPGEAGRPCPVQSRSSLSLRLWPLLRPQKARVGGTSVAETSAPGVLQMGRWDVRAWQREKPAHADPTTCAEGRGGGI